MMFEWWWLLVMFVLGLAVGIIAFAGYALIRHVGGNP